MSIRPGYRSTEFGEIPEEWKIVKLEDVAAEFKSGGTPSTSNPEYWNGKIPWMRSASIRGRFVDSGEKFITEQGLANSATNVVPSGSLLVASRVSIGNVAVNRLDIAISQDLTGVVVNKSRANEEYLYWMLKYRADKIKSLIQGSTIKGVLREDLKKLTILLPPVVEQREIATILATVDDTIQKTDEIIAKTQQFKNGLMQRLLTRGTGHTQFKKTQIGRIPDGWEIAELGSVLQLCQYGLSVPLYEKGKVPVFRMNNFEDGLVVPSHLKFADIDSELFNQFRLEKGDLLFNRTNSYDLVGKVGIFSLDGEYTFASYLIRLRVDPQKMDPMFLNYFLNREDSQARLRSLATRGVSQTNINATNLKSITIPLPPLQEQQQIVSLISSVGDKVITENRRNDLLQQLEKGLMQVLLTGKVRVKVN